MMDHPIDGESLWPVGLQRAHRIWRAFSTGSRISSETFRLSADAGESSVSDARHGWGRSAMKP